jgi:hypothetical protein
MKILNSLKLSLALYLIITCLQNCATPQNSVNQRSNYLNMLNEQMKNNSNKNNPNNSSGSAAGPVRTN